MEAQIGVLSTYSTGIPLTCKLYFSSLELIPKKTGKRIITSPSFVLMILQTDISDLYFFQTLINAFLAAINTLPHHNQVVYCHDEQMLKVERSFFFSPTPQCLWHLSIGRPRFSVVFDCGCVRLCLFFLSSQEFDQSSPFRRHITFITAHMDAGEDRPDLFPCRWWPHLTLAGLAHSLHLSLTSQHPPHGTASKA